MGVKSPIRTNDVFFGYEDGDLTKKVEIRITGVLSDVETIGDVSSVTCLLYTSDAADEE